MNQVGFGFLSDFDKDLWDRVKAGSDARRIEIIHEEASVERWTGREIDPVRNVLTSRHVRWISIGKKVRNPDPEGPALG